MQIAQIANNTKAALALLNIKFATPDQFKSTCGIIGIMAICTVAFGIFLNDIVDLFIYLLFDRKANDKKNVKKDISIKKEWFEIK